MKTIGIIGAMEEEVSILKTKMEVLSAKNIVGVDFFMGKMSGKNVIVVRSGIGKVNAAICSQVLIDLYGVDCIINVGVAGALHKDLEICDVVISKDTVQHDFNVSSFGHPKGVIPNMPESFFAADEEMIGIAKKICDEILEENKAYIGRIASGDVFVSAAEEKHRITDDFNALCVEMEGAAVGHVCYLNKIPFLVLRSISDKADEKSDTDFDEFVIKAAKQASDIVETMIKLI